MAYNPKALGVEERSLMLKLMWLGVPASLVHLLGQFVALPTPLDYIPGSLSAGTLIGGLFSTRHDEFIVRQIHRAAHCALGTAGLLLFASLPLFGPLMQIEAGLALALIATVFNLALGWFRLMED